MHNTGKSRVHDFLPRVAIRPNWKMKAAIFRALSGFPFSDGIHYWLQRHVTRTFPVSSSELDDCLIATKRKLKAFRTYSGADPARSVFLELGAGRDLASPLALSYAGVEALLALDIEPLARIDLVRTAAAHMAAAHRRPAPAIDSWADLKRQCRLEYCAPADARATGLPAKSFDCITAWSVLQHAPSEDVVPILNEARRLLKPAGIVIMKIHYEDMYARFDSSISPFNFLRFSDEEWRRYNSRLHHQNRMRHSEMLASFDRSRFEIVHEESNRAAPDGDILANLAPEFRSFAIADLFTSKAFIVARPK